jgi:hypothetical protein
LLFCDENIHKAQLQLNVLPENFGEENYPYAAHVTFVPKFESEEDKKDELVKGARTEFVFLVDRSGSMDGDRIKVAREVLVELLDQIPSDAYFNVVSFGSGF